MGALSGAVGWLVAGRALRPVHAITGAARRASEENLGERLALAGPPDELKELADTYDAMLARLDAAFASQRRFVANASHELRTPLTVMRTAIDVTLAKPGRTPAQLEDMAAEVRGAVDRAEALIEALLTLARSDRGTAAVEPADLAVLAEDALDAAGPAIRARSLRPETSLQTAPARGDLVLLDRLVANVVDNAVRHNAAGGWIQVATGTRDGQAYLTVTNGGPVIAEDMTPLLFEPFRRLCDPAGSVPGPAWACPSSGRSPPLTRARSRPAAAPRAAWTCRCCCPAPRPGCPGGPPRRPRPGKRLGFEVVGDGAEHGRDLLPVAGVRVPPPPVGGGHPVEQLDQVLDDHDHLVGVLPADLGDRRRRLEQPDLEGLDSPAPLGHAELDPLAGPQGGAARRQRRGMHEDLTPVVAGEKAESFVGVIPFDLASGHGPDLMQSGRAGERRSSNSRLSVPPGVR